MCFSAFICVMVSGGDGGSSKNKWICSLGSFSVPVVHDYPKIFCTKDRTVNKLVLIP